MNTAGILPVFWNGTGDVRQRAAPKIGLSGCVGFSGCVSTSQGSAALRGRT